MVTITDDDPPATAPSWADDTGNAQNWTQNTAITSFTVPAASGSPTPTYAVVGSLPTGISFSPTTRLISGTPTIAGNGTIRIRATNSEGTDDWTVAYYNERAIYRAELGLTIQATMLTGHVIQRSVQ